MKHISYAHCFLAVDIGATSGRVVICTADPGGRFEFREIHRFPNAILNISGKYYWDIFTLYASVLEGLRKCAAEGYRPESVGIDTWGVDFGFVGDDGTLLGLPRAYRDPYTEHTPEEFYNVVRKNELYDRTGIQIMSFNSIFQIFRQTADGFSPMKNASKLLFIPDLLSYMLTGKMVCEYTVASTSQLLNPFARDFDDGLLAAAGILLGRRSGLGILSHVPGGHAGHAAVLRNPFHDGGQFAEEFVGGHRPGSAGMVRADFQRRR